MSQKPGSGRTGRQLPAARRPNSITPQIKTSRQHKVISHLVSLAIFVSSQFPITASQRDNSEANLNLRPDSQEPRASSTISEESNALTYLQKYGYMNAHSNSEANNLISEDSLSNAIASFQRFWGIPETGSLDNETRRFMRLPRCGNPDQTNLAIGGRGGIQNPETEVPSSPVAQFSHQHPHREGPNLRGLLRNKRYALQGSKWRRQELTYRISQYPTRFNTKRHEVDTEIAKAFGIWSQVAPIDFIAKREGRVHIDIRFASGDHGDGDAFDGPGNTLAHAYFPQYGGDAHFDDQEYWTIDSYTGTNIFQVAAHELGHSLGLGHSNVREALMAPFYQKYKPNFKLHLDDILAIQALYGEKAILSPVDVAKPTNRSPFESPRQSNPSSSSTTTTSTTTTTTSSTTTTHAPPATPDEDLFNAEGPNFGRPHSHPQRPSWFGAPRHVPRAGPERGEDEGRPPIADIPNFSGNDNGIGIPSLNGFENRIDAFAGKFPVDLCQDSVIDSITRTEDGSTYMFKGDFYWLLNNEGLAKGYPRRIGLDWDGLSGPIDAALTWADGKTFFFKGNKYWRFKNRKREVGYPKLISSGFAGIPDDVDAAFVWSGNGRTYFFKGTEYWRFDSKADPPVSAEYPRSIKVWNGVPFHVNAAFKWENNVTYFFKGNQYYRFNDRDFTVETRGRPPFPRHTAEWWFGCQSSNSLAQRALPSEHDRPINLDWSLLPNGTIRHESKTLRASNESPDVTGRADTGIDLSSGATFGLPESRDGDASNWSRINFQNHDHWARSASSSAGSSNLNQAALAVSNLVTLIVLIATIYSSHMTKKHEQIFH